MKASKGQKQATSVGNMLNEISERNSKRKAEQFDKAEENARQRMQNFIDSKLKIQEMKDQQKEKDRKHAVELLKMQMELERLRNGTSSNLPVVIPERY